MYIRIALFVCRNDNSFMPLNVLPTPAQHSERMARRWARVVETGCLRTSANRFNSNFQDDPQQVSRPRLIQRAAHPAKRRRSHPHVFASNGTCGFALLTQILCSIWSAAKLAGSLPPNTPTSVVRVGTPEPGATARRVPPTLTLPGRVVEPRMRFQC